MKILMISFLFAFLAACAKDPYCTTTGYEGNTPVMACRATLVACQDRQLQHNGSACVVTPGTYGFVAGSPRGGPVPIDSASLASCQVLRDIASEGDRSGYLPITGCMPWVSP